jgi:Mn2+/Fe2+ NRAMP family transporter
MNGVLLPFVLVFMLLVLNRAAIMGELTNSRAYNLVAWATVVLLVALTVLVVVTSLLPAAAAREPRGGLGGRGRPAALPRPR